MGVHIYFSDFFDIDPDVLRNHGTVDISLINDIPLFIDPFLLFNSEDPALRALHDEIIRYVTFLRDKSAEGKIREPLLRDWFCFPEVKQLWLGYSLVGNEGSGLGVDFARKLYVNLNTVFQTFGSEQIARSAHLEKLCLIEAGVGRDNISDFTANLIKGYLASYTEAFAAEHLSDDQISDHAVEKTAFNYDTESWVTRTFKLPSFGDDYLLLAPRSILTKDETWINRADLINRFADIVDAAPNDVLRAKVNNYLFKKLPPAEEHTKAEEKEVIQQAIREFPEIIEYFIANKEDRGDEAVALSDARLKFAERRFIENVRQFVTLLDQQSAFYEVPGSTKEEARFRVDFLKDVIENKGGWRLFYVAGEPVMLEEHLQIVFRFTWLGTPSDVSREVNDGRGPADYKVSRGAFDKTIVEFKLARNRKLKQNLQNQVEIYQAASDAEAGLKVILYFDDRELARVRKILEELELEGHENIILIDGRPKESASRIA